MNQTFLAKTVKIDGTVHPGCSVYEHCRVVGIIAGLLAARYPDWIKEHFFPAGTELVAASHDIGKISPGFQEKLRRALGHAPNSVEGLENPKIAAPEMEKEWGGHPGVSAAALRALRCKGSIRNIAARHHGNIVSPYPYSANDEMLGGPLWQGYRTACLDALKEYFRCDWPEIVSPEQETLLSGLTSVADWIGSGEIASCDNASPEQCAKAVEAAGFVPLSVRAGLRFQDIFGNAPRAMQETLAAMCDEPGIYVLEAPMGLGKTEAALYAAYGLLASGKATGMYFGLPTRLTSNKIHERIAPFLNSILEHDPEANPHTAQLLHGMAHLEQAETGQEGEDSGGLWFSSLKRGILAPFGVGTIDQALMAAIPDIRHSFVRALGLLGKVVILDEVHSYDAYTFAIIRKLLTLLNGFGCTVIILSATLTAARRMALLGTDYADSAYPLLTCIKSVTPTCVKAEAVKREACTQAFPALFFINITITVTANRNAMFEAAIDRAGDGQQVLWIENTVAEAQDTYSRLAARCAELHIACGLIHSRFTAEHRSEREGYWTKLYGKDSEKRTEQGRILVGTQVLEQSLDIDADCLFSALCPMDMLLQRMGRLWRHEKNPRPKGALPAAFVILQQAADAPLTESSFGTSGAVYAPYVLHRTRERLIQAGASIRLPEDIRPLLEDTYASREESGVASCLSAQLEAKEKKLTALAARTTATWEQRLSDSEDALGTRYSEGATQSVLLVRDCRHLENGIILTLLNEEKVRLGSGTLPPQQRRKLAALLTRQIVQVHADTAPTGKIPFWAANCLRPLLYLGKEALAVGVVEASGAISNLDGSPASSTHAVQYTERLGYRAVKHSSPAS